MAKFIMIISFKMFHLVSLLLLAVTVISATTAFDDTVVQLPKGKIRGHILKSEQDKPYYAFQEIPYAAPPVGKNRFQLPKEPDSWSGVLNTTKNTVVCYQKIVKYKNLNISEDCLYINVYTPVVPGTKKLLPVLLWVHGGAFAAESSTFEYYGPKFIMDHNVVVVTFNYRLGPFGFLSTYDDVIPPNIGMKDQHMAIEWVHDNIGLFGGNKSHITLVGESAGSKAVGLHLLGPWQNNKVLFHAAVMQSGSPLFLTRGNTAKEAAFRIGQAVNVSFTPKNSQELLEVLQQVPAADILAANTTGADWPILEKEGIFGYHTYDIKKIPLLIGFNSEEWLYDMLNPNVKEIAAGYDTDPSKLIDVQFNLSSVNRSIAGNLLRKIYTNSTFVGNMGAYVRFDSDDRTTTPTTKQAELHSKFADVYLYQFAYKGELGMQMHLPVVEGAERVAHAEDLKYIWDDQTNSDLSKFPEEDRQMFRRYIKLWTNFVKYHNPTPEKDPLLQNIIWPKVDPKKPEEIHYLNLNSTFEIRTNPRYYQAVKQVLDYYVTPKDII